MQLLVDLSPSSEVSMLVWKASERLSRETGCCRVQTKMKLSSTKSGNWLDRSVVAEKDGGDIADDAKRLHTCATEWLCYSSREGGQYFKCSRSRYTSCLGMWSSRLSRQLSEVSISAQASPQIIIGFCRYSIVGSNLISLGRLGQSESNLTCHASLRYLGH